MNGDIGLDQPNSDHNLSSGWSEADQNILDQVKSSGIPTIVLMLSGRLMNITDRISDWDAFIAAWLPGTEGTGISDLIYGDYGFTGKLSVSWPKSFDGDDVKVNLGDSTYLPLFPYNYGLNTLSDNTVQLPGVIEAENYNVGNGVLSENTEDNNGGLNLGYIDQGDWMDYQVDVPVAGSYSVRMRVASMGGASGAIQLKLGSTVLANYDVPDTGGWQDWTTVTKVLYLNAGVQTLRVSAASSGWNINWIDFIPVNSTVNNNYIVNAGLMVLPVTG